MCMYTYMYMYRGIRIYLSFFELGIGLRLPKLPPVMRRRGRATYISKEESWKLFWPGLRQGASIEADEVRQNRSFKNIGEESKSQLPSSTWWGLWI